MGLTKKQNLVLFLLGKLCEEVNKGMKDRLLEVAVSKPAFIEIVRKSGLADKGERAIYKNLEDLEKSRHISYENKILKLTKKGQSVHEKTNRQLAPYISIIKTIDSENLIKLTKKARTTFISN